MQAEYPRAAQLGSGLAVETKRERLAEFINGHRPDLYELK